MEYLYFISYLLVRKTVHMFFLHLTEGIVARFGDGMG